MHGALDGERGPSTALGATVMPSEVEASRSPFWIGITRMLHGALDGELGPSTALGATVMPSEVEASRSAHPDIIALSANTGSCLL